ncbi:hypothetical protein AXK11_00885 [Cephaloticoccus primus]|uniref:Probable nicotinate-nucleotide adenylyltransferase n=1 Tax=Cephaloticoccus primus TaxID=1548207 RepID=A0A139SUJ2_9BACT|nr:nicotinate-nucleotide adenylyltransferase [Cephaloticoccus primus]KXU38235.1 hypothetical protein AXK11_00885 [Cephaloticoccus primus]
MRIGLYGGSFDPVHLGHLIAAQSVYEHCGLERVIFIPAAQAPLKSGAVQASGEDRLAMLTAAIEGDPRFEVSDIELRRGGLSYTKDTVDALRGRYPGDALFWIIGADQLAQLPRWHEIEALAAQVEFIAVGRPGGSGAHEPRSAHASERPAAPAPTAPPFTPTPIPGLRVQRHSGPLIDISSTQLRERARRGLPLDYLIPHKALVYLQAHCLYRDAS